MSINVSIPKSVIYIKVDLGTIKQIVKFITKLISVT